MADAKENNTVLHSPVFYSSRHGYKLRVNMCSTDCKKSCNLMQICVERFKEIIEQTFLKPLEE